MNREFLLARAKGRAAGILLVLAIFALPTSAVFAARASTPAGEQALPNGVEQIPTYEPPLDLSFPQSNNKPVAYNKITGEVIFNWYEECKTCQFESTEWKKLENYDFNPKWPASPTVKIESTWPSGQKNECSGILVDQTTVLTVAHCIFTHKESLCDNQESCWVVDLQITIYQDSAKPPSGFTELLTWTAWTKNHDYDYDLAGIKLDQTLGDAVGWLGFGYNNDNQFFSNKTFLYTSFPTEDGGAPNTSSPFNFTGIEVHDLYSNDPGRYGQAGAGAHSNDYFHVVYSVLSHHHEVEGETKTAHTRITKDKFSALRSWMEGTIKDLNFITYLPLITD